MLTLGNGRLYHDIILAYCVGITLKALLCAINIIDLNVKSLKEEINPKWIFADFGEVSFDDLCECREFHKLAIMIGIIQIWCKLSELCTF